MPRAASGPRRIDSSGTWFAVKVISGKRHTISLKTKIKSEAHRLWPAAQAQLEDLANPTKRPARTPVDGLMYLSERGDPIAEGWDYSDNLAQTHISSEEDEDVITWAKAEDVAARRYQRRRGKAVSRSWRYQILNALRHLDVKYPLDTKPSDVRRMVEGMEAKGYKATTIAQRASALSGVIDALIKGGYTDDDYGNPFSRVDTAAVSTATYYKPEPSDYHYMWSRRGELTLEQQRTLQILIFTGARIDEVVRGTYKTAGYLYVPKEIAKNRASIRTIPLPSPIHEGIGVCSSEDQLRRGFNKIRPPKKGQQMTPHSFRHGFKTAARTAAADELTIERWLGHTVGSQISQRYGEYPLELLEKESLKVWAVIEMWNSGAF